jgi:AhpD family alkylhydroperoxidase
MTLRSATLTATETELVAIGASIGAGCHPCLDYHLQEGSKAGLGRETLLQAVADGECVKRSAYNELAVRSRELLGEAADLPPSCCDDTNAIKEFVSVGSAVGANSVAQLRKHIEQARTVGIDEAQLIQAIEIAGNVQRHAGAATAREAEALTGVLAQGHSPVFLSAPASQVGQDACGADCACNAGAENEKFTDDNREAKLADSEITEPSPGKCC